MTSSALLLALLLGSRALPPAQEHVANALIHASIDLGVAASSIHASAAGAVEATQPRRPRD